MELNTNTGFFVANKELKETKFKINASAKAFKILSDSLYTNKIKAIVRELSCNAYDAHVAAKTQDKKFIVHLPTFHKPEFYIRDFGTGLSKADIEQIYTTYFESTKTQSNDYIGCLGLGSKTPFCYTDSFIVKSYHNGKLYTYNAFLDDEELPNIALISETNTDESNGLEVRFSVKERDFSSFVREATEVFYWFKDAPQLIGLTLTETYQDLRAKSLKKDTWVAVSLENSGRKKPPVILMGNVAYPIDLVSIDPALTCLVHDSNLLNLVIELGIGDVEVAASREALSINKTSREKIKTIIQNINKEYLKTLEEEVLAQPTWLDACILYNERISKFAWDARDKIERHFEKIEKDGNVICYQLKLPYQLKSLVVPTWRGNLRSQYETNIAAVNIQHSIFVFFDPSIDNDSKLRTFLRNYHNEKDTKVRTLFTVNRQSLSITKEWLLKHQVPKEHIFDYGTLPKITATRAVSTSARAGKKYDDCYLIYDAALGKTHTQTYGYKTGVSKRHIQKFDPETTNDIYYLHIVDKVPQTDIYSVRSMADRLQKVFGWAPQNVIGLTLRQIESCEENEHIIDFSKFYKEKLIEKAKSVEFLKFYKLRLKTNALPSKYNHCVPVIEQCCPKLKQLEYDYIENVEKEYLEELEKSGNALDETGLYFDLSNNVETEKERAAVAEENRKEIEAYNTELKQVKESLPDIVYYVDQRYNIEGRKQRADKKLEELLEIEFKKMENK